MTVTIEKKDRRQAGGHARGGELQRRGRERTRASFADESGQAVVEFAVVLTLFCLLVFGITQFGQALNTANDETHLADMAARYAAVNYNPSTSGQSFVAWVKAQGGTSYSRNGTVSICFPNGTSNVGDPVEIVLKSSAFSMQPVSALFQVAGTIGITSPITIRGQAVMRLEAQPTAYSATGSCA